jgi:methyl coenzyme M reductase alpha subunit
MTEKVARMRIVLDIGAEETLVGVGTPDGDPTLVQVPVGLSAGLEAVLKAAAKVATQSPDVPSGEA